MQSTPGYRRCDWVGSWSDHVPAANTLLQSSFGTGPRPPPLKGLGAVTVFTPAQTNRTKQTQVRFNWAKKFWCENTLNICEVHINSCGHTESQTTIICSADFCSVVWRSVWQQDRWAGLPWRSTPTGSWNEPICLLLLGGQSDRKKALLSSKRSWELHDLPSPRPACPALCH